MILAFIKNNQYFDGTVCIWFVSTVPVYPTCVSQMWQNDHIIAVNGTYFVGSVFLFCRYEAMSDLVALFSTLVDEKGNILVPGVNDSVRELTPEEEALYANLDFDMVWLTSHTNTPFLFCVARVSSPTP